MKHPKALRKSARTPKAKVNKDSFDYDSPRSGKSPASASESKGKKRARSLSPLEPLPKVQKNIVDGREVDNYCWVCHESGYDRICQSCPRVYHAECTDDDAFNTQGSCPECQLQSVSQENEACNISRSFLTELLKIALHEALKDNSKRASSSRSQNQSKNNSKFEQYFKTWPMGNSDFLCQIVDLEFLIDKVNDDINCYLTTAEFFSDVKWIHHNCYILYGPNSDITENSLKLEKNIKTELLNIEACPECYHNLYSDDYLHADFFTVLCTQPHDIVWAKLRGSPYWPAKCLKLNNGYAEVRFFGKHQKSCVPVNQCYRISQESPNDRKIKLAGYNDAMRELSIYVSNYKRVYGSFRFYPRKMPLEDPKSAKKPFKKGCFRKSTGGKLNESISSAVDTRENTLSLENSDLADQQNGEDTSDPLFQSKTELLDTQGEATANSEDFPASNGIQNESAPPAMEAVSVCMDFTEEAPPAFSTNSGLKEASQTSTLPDSILAASSNLSEAQDSAMPFVNSDGPDSLPVITSAVSGEIPDGDDPIFSPGRSSPASPELFQSSLFANHSRYADSQQRSVPGGLFRSYMKPTSSDEDEIEIIQEVRKESPTIKSFIKNQSLLMDFCKIAARSQPNLEKFFAEWLQFAMKSYLQLGLSPSLQCQDESAISNFSKLYEQMEKNTKEMRKEIDSMKQEIAALKQENLFLNQDNERLHAKVKELQEHNHLLESRLKNSKDVISALLSKATAGAKSNSKLIDPPSHHEETQSNDHFYDDENSLLDNTKFESVLSNGGIKMKDTDDSEKNSLLGNENSIFDGELPEMDNFSCTQNNNEAGEPPDQEVESTLYIDTTDGTFVSEQSAKTEISYVTNNQVPNMFGNFDLTPDDLAGINPMSDDPNAPSLIMEDVINQPEHSVGPPTLPSEFEAKADSGTKNKKKGKVAKT